VKTKLAGFNLILQSTLRKSTKKHVMKKKNTQEASKKYCSFHFAIFLLLAFFLYFLHLQMLLLMEKLCGCSNRLYVDNEPSKIKITLIITEIECIFRPESPCT